MLYALATLAVMTLAPISEARADSIRIGLFSLFKPDSLQARIASHGEARLDVGGLGGGRVIVPNETVQFRASGNEVHLVILDCYGRVRGSASGPEMRVAPAGSSM